MRIFTISTGDFVKLGDLAIISVSKVAKSRVRFGIEADKSVSILREECKPKQVPCQHIDELND